MGSGAVLLRFFCFLGVVGVWGQIVLLLKKHPHLWAHGAHPLRIDSWPVPGARKRVPGPWFETSYTSVERGAARFWRLVNALAARAVPGGR